MQLKETLNNEIEHLPESFIAEVIDFVQFLKEKHARQMETLLISESSLKKDWLLPEEDEAWKNL